MAFVPVPKDLTRMKTKVAFNLTKRQLVCFALAAAVGVPTYFLLKTVADTSIAVVFMVIIMLPLFLFAMYEKHGQPLEVILKHIIAVQFLRPKQRPYRTDNFYTVLARQATLDKEVKAIVSKNQKTAG